MGNGPAGVSFKDINNYQRQNAAKLKQELETQRPAGDGAAIDKQEEALAKDDVVSSQAIKDYAAEHGWDKQTLEKTLKKYDADGGVDEGEFDKLSEELQDRAKVDELFQQANHRPPTEDEAEKYMGMIADWRKIHEMQEKIFQMLEDVIKRDAQGAAAPAAPPPSMPSAPSAPSAPAAPSGPAASGGSPGGSAPSGSSSAPAASSSGGGAPAPAAAGPAQEPSTATTAKAGEVPYINQYSDSKYNNGSNCGPTSMAMIAKAFGYGTNLSNGDLIATLGQAGGTTEAGTSWAGIKAMAAKMGKPCEEHGPDANWIKQQLEAGKLVCANGDYYSMPPHDAGKRGQGGHYVAIIGMDANGNFLVNDPADKGISPKAYTAAQIESFMRGNPNGGQAFAIG